MDELQSDNLPPTDRQAIDALVDAGMDLDAVDPAHRERAGQVHRVMQLLDHLPAEAPGDLLAERTIQAIERAKQAEHASQRATAIGGGAVGRPMRWGEIGAVAAMLIVSLSLAMPMLARHRASAQQAACQSNLATAGFGFASYAHDNAGALPSVKSKPGDPWFHHNTFDERGNTQSNSAHFYLLVRTGHADARDLSCPANPTALIRLDTDARDWPDAPSRSFSFPNMFITVKPKWGGSITLPVAVDRNPVFADADHAHDRTAPSPNHRGLAGQNVLFNDGTVRWMDKPVLEDGDNLWHIDSATGQQRASYQGTETPDDSNDAFLIP